MFYISLIVAFMAAYYSANMSNKQGERFLRNRLNKKQITPGSGEFFDGIASRYDFFNQVISLGHDLGWRKKALSKLPAISSILDVSTGTADLAIALAANRSIRVVGIDPSEKMLNAGQKKIDILSEMIGKVELVQGVAEELPFEDASFDAVIVAFGVRNFQDREKGLSEMARVLKPDGRLVVMELSLPKGDAFLDRVTRAFVEKVVPKFAGVISGNGEAYQYLSDSMAGFPDAHVFRNMLSSVGIHLESHEKLSPFGMGPDLYSAKKQVVPKER